MFGDWKLFPKHDWPYFRCKVVPINNSGDIRMPVLTDEQKADDDLRDEVVNFLEVLMPQLPGSSKLGNRIEGSLHYCVFQVLSNQELSMMHASMKSAFHLPGTYPYGIEARENALKEMLMKNKDVARSLGLQENRPIDVVVVYWNRENSFKDIYMIERLNYK